MQGAAQADAGARWTVEVGGGRQGGDTGTDGERRVARRGRSERPWRQQLQRLQERAGGDAQQTIRRCAGKITEKGGSTVWVVEARRIVQTKLPSGVERRWSSRCQRRRLILGRGGRGGRKAADGNSRRIGGKLRGRCTRGHSGQQGHHRHLQGYGHSRSGRLPSDGKRGKGEGGRPAGKTGRRVLRNGKQRGRPQGLRSGGKTQGGPPRSERGSLVAAGHQHPRSGRVAPGGRNLRGAH